MLQKCILLFAVVVSATFTLQANLLNNGSFESGSEGWELINENGAEANADFENTDASDGSKSCLLSITKVADAQSDVFLKVPSGWETEFGSVYKVSFSAKANAASQISVVVFDSVDASINIIDEKEYILATSGEWQTIEFHFTSESQTGKGLHVGLLLGSGVAEIALDAFSIEEDPSYFSAPYKTGAYTSGVYRNLFKENGKTDAEVDERLNEIFDQLFYGNNSNERVYYQITDSSAYILDVHNSDIRSEGMSYGMMICVQMNKKFEFDCLWNYAKHKMQHKSGARKGYFAWSYNPRKDRFNDYNSAPDGEEYFAMALFFAAHRWGDKGGIYNYGEEANQLLYDMLHLEERNGGVVSGLTNMFNLDEKKVVFVPQYDNADYSDPSYHLPAFYDLWALWAKQDNQFWADAADTSRVYLHKAMHPNTGFTTDYMTFDAKPQETTFNDRSHHFSGDSWRVAMNVAMDCSWWGQEDWHSERLDSLLEFVSSKGTRYQSQFTQDGELLSPNWEGTGFYAMNGVAPLGATTQNSWDFIKKSWSLQIPTGTYRYYDGLLYLLGFLNTAGEYKIWNPGDDAITPEPEMPEEIKIFDPFAEPETNIQSALNHQIKVMYNADKIKVTIDSDEVVKSVKLIDITGTVVCAENQHSENSIEISTNEITNGLYFITVELPSGVAIQKFILNK